MSVSVSLVSHLHDVKISIYMLVPDIYEAFNWVSEKMFRQTTNRNWKMTYFLYKNFGQKLLPFSIRCLFTKATRRSFHLLGFGAKKKDPRNQRAYSLILTNVLNVEMFHGFVTIKKVCTLKSRNFIAAGGRLPVTVRPLFGTLYWYSQHTRQL